jgi:hypothetical protein
MCLLLEGYAGYTHFPHLTIPDKIEANVSHIYDKKERSNNTLKIMTRYFVHG